MDDCIILLQEQKIDIINKIKLYNVLINLNVAIPNYGRKLITEISQEAWQSTPPKNGMSLIKSLLSRHYKARKINQDLPIPEKCKGYKIIKVFCYALSL